jgi:hypothetical protein
MSTLKHHSKDSIDVVIKQMTKDLNSLKKSRKVRSDVGKKRCKYDTGLPKKYKQYLTSANSRSIKFELTVEEFQEVINQNCVYCGDNSKIGIDRVDSSNGYSIDNVQPCCGKCNLMKFTHTEEVFLKHIIKIVKYRDLIK